MNRRRACALGIGALWPPAAVRAATTPPAGECIIPAKAGGGFELTCRLAQQMLADSRNLQLRYLPGGIGAVAYTEMVTQRPDQDSTIVAFSSGSLLNLAQGKFGPHTEHDVRWLAVVGADYGVIAVRKDSPLRTLGDLIRRMKSDASSVTFGAGGTLGSQDWFKAALLARAAGVSHKGFRFVAFEGGGDAMLALEGGHVTVFSGDAGEFSQFAAGSPGIRVLAVLSERRLTGPFTEVPTAREQGVDLVWPTARGFYLGAKVSQLAYDDWATQLRSAVSKPTYQQQLASYGLQPMGLFGEPLQDFIRTSMARYRKLAAEFDMMTRQRK